MQAARMKREALAVATGNTVRIFDGASYCPSYKAKGKVLDVQVFNGMLVHCGDYEGICDMLSGQIVAGQGHSWRRMAVHNNKIYAAMHTNKSANYGVYDLMEDRKIAHRPGPTHTLIAWYGAFSREGISEACLWDSGEYTQDLWLDTRLRNLCMNDWSIAHECGKHILAATNMNKEVLFVTRDQVKATSEAACFNKGKPSRIIYTHNTSLLELAQRIFPVDEIAWKKQLLKNVDHLKLNPRDSSMTLSHQIIQHYEKTEGLSAIAVADQNIYIGDRRGRISMIDGNHLCEVHTMKSPIESMCTVPAELYTKGLRQKISRVMSNRHFYAGKSLATKKKAA
jgi:hypothetical protein